IFYFFFSSRRRHTRFSRDWSSDVCSSDHVMKTIISMRLKIALVAIISLLVTHRSLAQYPVGPDGYERLGVLNGKSAAEIKSSTWSIGGETLDRDYADYQSYKEYLGPLGAKRIRLQAGWAKTEKKQGEYDFTWLDDIIDDAINQGVQPWLCLSYGNPIYAGGGEPKLGGGLP